MVTDNPVHDHHADSMTFLFGGKIRFEYMRKIFFTNACPLINNLSEHVIGIYTGNDSNFRICRYRINRIADYVEKSLLKLFCITVNKGFSDPRFHSNIYILSAYFSFF